MAKLYLGTREVTPAIFKDSTKYGCTVDTLLGDVDANGVLQIPGNSSGNIVFTGVKDVGTAVLYYRFFANTNLTGSVTFPDLENASNDNGLYYSFYQTKITVASLPKLKTVTGGNALGYAFALTKITSLSLPELTIVSGANGFRGVVQNCSLCENISIPKLQEVSGNYGLAYFANSTKITTLSFPMLSKLTGSYAFQNLIGSCQYITDVYFPALTTSSFGSKVNQFTNMCNSLTANISGNVTIHFPSNLETLISTFNTYPLFGGTSSKITLMFDLTATS